MSRPFGPDELIALYRSGVFPMADARDDPSLFFVEPQTRGILPLNSFRVPSRLARAVRSDRFEVTADKAFTRVLTLCAEANENRPGTWINDRIISLYSALHARGQAHSIECWLEGELVGGLYGVSLGAAFFGESMFSRATDASKVALVHLVARLRVGGYKLLDAQFPNPHLEQFGQQTWSRDHFRRVLFRVQSLPADFFALDRLLSEAESNSAAYTKDQFGAGASAGAGASPSGPVVTGANSSTTSPETGDSNKGEAGAPSVCGGGTNKGVLILQLITQTS